jgi:predicted DNA repair protein MutK
MAGASLLALLDDIASVLDDMAVLTKAATKKTTGVLGDDLVLNAQQVSGVRTDRELPVVWAAARGSAVNKAILVPAALGISALAPWAVTPLLMAGGTFLCYEGVEKLAHRAGNDHGEAGHQAALAVALTDPAADLANIEKDKIKCAIRTDFIRSAEIIVITLGTVAEAVFGTRVTVLVGIAALMTVGVYGLVAGIVRLNDAGVFLSRQPSTLARPDRRHDPARSAVADEGPVGGRHGGHVPGRRWYRRPRHAASAPPRRRSGSRGRPPAGDRGLRRAGSVAAG